MTDATPGANDGLPEPMAANVPEAFVDKTTQRYRDMPAPVRIYILLASAGGVAAAIYYIFLPSPPLDLTYYFFLMAMYLPIAYLLLPAHKKEIKAGWLSYLPALAALATTIFLSTQGRNMTFQSWVPPNDWQFVVAIIMFVLVIEAGRRAGGLIFTGIVLALGLYPIFAQYMPGIFWGPPFPISRTIGFNVYSGDALLGIVTRVVGEVLIGFLIMAALLVATGAADFFLKLALGLMGTARGGPAKVAVLASGFFGSLSGSIFGNVVGTGSVTIPSMKRAGFPAHYAGALEACASTGGMLMPPVMGAVAFIMADFTNTEYAVIVIAAAIPSLLYYYGLYCHVDAYAAKAGLAGLPREELPSLMQTMKDGWPFIAVLAFLIWGLVFMRWERLTPFYASALLLALTFFKKSLRLDRKQLLNVLYEIGKLLSQTMALLLPTSFILGGMMGTGVAPVITADLMRLGGENVALVLGIGVLICIIFGMMGMLIAAYLMLALTLAPALEQIAGLNTLAIHLFIAYYAMLAAITPPIALAAFIASRISDSDPMRTSWHAARLGIVLYFIPFFFLFEPALIFQGALIDTVTWFSFNIIAVTIIAGASEGRLLGFGLLRGWVRVVLFAAALLIGFPEWQTTLAGGLIVGAIIALRGYTRLPGQVHTNA
ncbi:MAG: TRAP transporter fused permease subunit [Rhodospirillaceae bacterium]|nr:TRAP transporter fused permease subunit [Rhodospirillaceae bacterium]MBT3887525.1 TRAP transporter fused permease subunit [Rhodospirillaceae bacterium]MBT4116367.1 TRAP transporter fused permease subunit [Rhodospirillaceae bacterium]MBT4672295.1 TRAP transporter fused permease subunit [Rhodospirillaceae bacterium]MBT4721612.1 TRAP transporter fused permease subunit [Rhodospirillaceae bacterium]